MKITRKDTMRLVPVVLTALSVAACGGQDAGQGAAAKALETAEAKIAEMESRLAATKEFDEQIAAVMKLIDVWDTANVDELDAIAVPEYTRVAPDQNANSLEELKAFIKEVHSVYPDFSITGDGIAAGPDGVFTQWTVTGSDTGTAENPSGNSINLTGISRYQFRNGKIVSELVVFDTGAALTQLDRTNLPREAD